MHCLSLCSVQLALARRSQLEQEGSAAHCLSLNSLLLQLAPRSQLEQEGSVAHRLSLNSLLLQLARRSQLEQEGLVMHCLSLCSGQSAFAPNPAPCRAVLVRAECAGALVHASRIPNTLETMRLRRHSPSQSIQQKIVDSPSTEHYLVA